MFLFSGLLFPDSYQWYIESWLRSGNSPIFFPAKTQKNMVHFLSSFRILVQHTMKLVQFCGQADTKFMQMPALIPIYDNNELQTKMES